MECEESGYLVNVVDWGVKEYVSDSRVFRQIPDECLGVPVQAVPLHLPIVALEECDTLLALLTECLLSAEVRRVFFGSGFLYFSFRTGRWW